MTDKQVNPFQHLVRPLNILKNCQFLSERLLIEGLTIKLSEAEQEQLLSFEQLLSAGYSDSEWGYLRVASGVKVKGVAALTGCLALFRAGEPKPIYGQL